MGVRRQAREAALQAVFRCDFLNEWEIDAIRFCFEHFGISETAEPFAVRLCEGVLDNFVQIDSKLTCASENWSLSRMARVDRSILRIATYEIAFLDEVPVNVAINEAIEVAKRFGSEESPVFVNGVLDKVASTYRSQLQTDIEVIKTVEPIKEEPEAVEKSLDVAIDAADTPEESTH